MCTPETDTASRIELPVPNRWELFDRSNTIITPDSLKAFGFEGYPSYSKVNEIDHVWKRDSAPVELPEDSQFVIYLSAPSGVGKDSLMQGVKLQRPGLITPFVTCTDRPIRTNKGEVDGVDYDFVTPEEFNEKIKNHEFIEWSLIHKGEHKAGIPRASLEAIMSSGTHPVFRITLDGIASVRGKIDRLFKTRSISIGLLPETTLSDYKNTLISRRKDEKGEDVLKRFANAKTEMEQMAKGKYQTDFIIGNPPNPTGKPLESIDAFLAIIDRLVGNKNDVLSCENRNSA
jgi:guanylate kinase